MSEIERNWSRKTFLKFGELMAASLLLNPAEAAGSFLNACADLKPQDTKPPTVGVIRWDGLFENSKWGGYIRDKKWRDRWPFYTKVSDQGEVLELRGDRQEVMDQEISYAREGLIDFWAFCYYDPRGDHARYNYGNDLYIASRESKKPDYSLIIQGTHVGHKEGWGEFTDLLTRHFNSENYQLVEGKRPLLFIYDVGEFNSVFGYYDQTTKALEVLRNKTVRLGLGDPYIVGQNTEGELTHLGFDALGAYAVNGVGPKREFPYERLVDANIAYCDAIKNKGFYCVPTLHAGWDPRPRENDPQVGKYYTGAWYSAATPDQIKNMLQRGLAWLRDNPNCSPGQLLLMNAWNELGEGSRIVPTYYGGGKYLEAIKEVLGSLRA